MNKQVRKIYLSLYQHYIRYSFWAPARVQIRTVGGGALHYPWWDGAVVKKNLETSWALLPTLQPAVWSFVRHLTFPSFSPLVSLWNGINGVGHLTSWFWISNDLINWDAEIILDRPRVFLITNEVLLSSTASSVHRSKLFLSPNHHFHHHQHRQYHHSHHDRRTTTTTHL